MPKGAKRVTLKSPSKHVRKVRPAITRTKRGAPSRRKR